MRVGGLVAHGGGERAEDGVQELKHLVLVDAVPALPRRLAQRALHGHQQGGDVDEAAHFAEHGAGSVTLAEHRQQSLMGKGGRFQFAWMVFISQKQTRHTFSDEMKEIK